MYENWNYLISDFHFVGVYVFRYFKKGWPIVQWWQSVIEERTRFGVDNTINNKTRKKNLHFEALHIFVLNFYRLLCFYYY